MLVKNKLHLLPFFLVSCLGLLFVINNNQVMAMNNNNKDKKIKTHEPSDKELNDFFQLLNNSKQIILEIRKTIPYLKNASIKEIDEWARFSNIQQINNKRLKTIDLNKTPEKD
ncbi:MAG: SVM family protein [Candidatus Phytoplasma australasiaticum]|nr:SVM family protein [Candidatus Phytoplasma australasiaticum]